MTARAKVDPAHVRVRYIAECRRGERGAKTRTAAAFGITPPRAAGREDTMPTEQVVAYINPQTDLEHLLLHNLREREAALAAATERERVLQQVCSLKDASIINLRQWIEGAPDYDGMKRWLIGQAGAAIEVGKDALATTGNAGKEQP